MMNTDDNPFRKGEWRNGQFYPYKSQADLGSSKADLVRRQELACGWQPSDDDDKHGVPVQPSRGPGIPAADLELLTLAARAIGAVRVETVDGENWLVLHFADGTVVHGWNSMQFSGDAFEMLVRLQMHVEAYDDSVEVFFGEGGHVEEGFTGTDPYAATRLAATRAAAEIRKAKG
jgi:hypothetical protein